jgi:hypothetical protein
MKTKTILTSLGLALAFTFPTHAADITSADSSAVALTKEEARAIAKDAYIYGFPLVDNYRIQYGYFVDTTTFLAYTRQRIRRFKRPTPIRPIPLSAWISGPNRSC